MKVVLQLCVYVATLRLATGWVLPPNYFILDFNTEQINYDAVVIHLPASNNTAMANMAVKQLKHFR
jgi:hypothetical protein